MIIITTLSTFLMLLQQGLGHGDAINDISVDPGRPCIVLTASRVGAHAALTASKN